MNDDFDSVRYRPDQPGPTPSPGPEASPRLRGTTHLKALRTSPMPANLGANLHWFSGAPPLAFLRRHWTIAVFVALLMFPLAGVFVGYISRPSTGSAAQADAGITTSTDTAEKQAKPSAGKPQLAASQAPPPVVMHPLPSSALEPQAPPAMSVPARPLNPAPGMANVPPNAPQPPSAVAANSPYTPMVYSARHDKVFGEGCAGQLTLDNNGLAFRCPDDPGGSVHVALGDIEAVDGNGVRLISGKKYHFSIAGMGRSNEQQLFANWLSRVR
jgi:hypothetical protein